MSHTSDVSWFRACLIFEITYEIAIDAGQLIYEGIKRALVGGLRDGLLHPRLIGGLCAAVGVEVNQDEELLKPRLRIRVNQRVRKEEEREKERAVGPSRPLMLHDRHIMKQKMDVVAFDQAQKVAEAEQQWFQALADFVHMPQHLCPSFPQPIAKPYLEDDDNQEEVAGGPSTIGNDATEAAGGQGEKYKDDNAEAVEDQEPDNEEENAEDEEEDAEDDE